MVKRFTPRACLNVPPNVSSLFDQADLGVPLCLLLAPPYIEEDPSIRDVRRIPKLWGQEEEGRGGRTTTTPEPLLTSSHKSARSDNATCW